jgi:hypothetical protein
MGASEPCTTNKDCCPWAVIVLVGTKADLWNQSTPNEITQAMIDEVAATVHTFKSIT